MIINHVKVERAVIFGSSIKVNTLEANPQNPHQFIILLKCVTSLLHLKVRKVHLRIFQKV